MRIEGKIKENGQDDRVLVLESYLEVLGCIRGKEYNPRKPEEAIQGLYNWHHNETKIWPGTERTIHQWAFNVHNLPFEPNYTYTGGGFDHEASVTSFRVWVFQTVELEYLWKKLTLNWWEGGWNWATCTIDPMGNEIPPSWGDDPKYHRTEENIGQLKAFRHMLTFGNEWIKKTARSWREVWSKVHRSPVIKIKSPQGVYFSFIMVEDPFCYMAVAKLFNSSLEDDFKVQESHSLGLRRRLIKKEEDSFLSSK